MSGWTVVTFRGRESQNYEKSRHNDTDPWKATSDIVATMEEDSRVRYWTVWKVMCMPTSIAHGIILNMLRA